MKTKRLETIEREARDRGLFTLRRREKIGTNPKTGKIVKLRNRHSLYMYDSEGRLVAEHKSGVPRSNNERAERKLIEVLDKKAKHGNTT